MHAATTDPLVGRVLEGRYRIRARLADGGMSTVYAGLDERLDRDVAVKVMASSLSMDRAFVHRFIREARTAARLSHVNAVSVYDQGSDGAHVFLVMELVRGRTLRDLLRERGALSPAEAVSVMEPILLALAAAHRAGLVHRDVKPENVLLADDGTVKVADFGLARAVEADASATHTGLLMGTVAYSSPEQFRRGNADVRCDVYSAGIVLFELLTGRPPYQGPDAMSVAYQHVHHDVPPPSAWQRGIAPPLDDLVRRATARDPQRRPADAGRLLAELGEVRRILRLPVRGVPPRPRAARPAPHPTRPEHNRPEHNRPEHNRSAPSVASAASAATVANPPARQPVRPTLQQHPVQQHPVQQHPVQQYPAQHTPVEPRRTQPPPAPGRPPRRRRRHRFLRTLLGTLILLLVCAALIAGSWWFASGRYSSIPDVQNRTTRQAVESLRQDGFQVITDPARISETVARGDVIATVPAGGTRTLSGKRVHVVPSAGPHLYPLPDLRSRTKVAAATAVAGMQHDGVRFTYSEKADDRVPAGSVISTDPVGGTSMRRDQTVVVYVSTGPPIVTVPDVHGQDGDAAASTLKNAGFTVRTAQAYSDDVPAGQVIATDPAAGSSQRKFAAVTITVSQGPEFIEVPDIARFTPLSTAQQALADAGFTNVVVQVAVDGGDGQTVLTVKPRSGERARRGDRITLYVF